MTTIKDAVEDLFNHQTLSVEEAVDRHYAPSFRQRTNGTWDERPAFLARIAGLREVVDHVGITVLDEVTEAGRYAERHIADLVQRDGTRVRQEVYVFAERDSDGRFVRIEESTLTLDRHQEEA